MTDDSSLDVRIAPLGEETTVAVFDCGDAELNAFLQESARAYARQGIAITYVALAGTDVVGFFSVCADAIRLSKGERKAEFGKEKPHRDYPAIKIARLAVANRFQRTGLGTFLVKQVVGKAAMLSSQIGVRFITVDAYRGNVAFYHKCGFLENEEDADSPNASMRLDLLVA